MRRFFRLALIVLFFLPACASLPISGAEQSSQTSWIKTADGWTLALHHHRPSRIDAAIDPVLLVPDVYENAAVYNIDGDHSLIDVLNAAGIDVYVIELRGQGMSEKPAWWNYRRWDWTFDDYVRLDLPAAVEAVTAQSEGSRVILAGHGFGGSAALAYAASQSDKVSRVIGFGVAGRTGRINTLQRLLLDRRDRLDLLANLPVPAGATTPAPVVGSQQNLLDVLLCNDPQMDEATTTAYYARALEPVSLGVARQVEDWLLNETFRSYDRQTDYQAALLQITCPVLLLAGGGDKLVEPDWTRELPAALGGSDKQVRVLSTAEGDAADYSHVGLLLGDEAENEVGDFVVHWLRERMHIE